MLILFDIDLTLIESRGVGMRSMEAAGRRLFGPAFSASGIRFGGQLDPVILAQMLDRIGLEPTRERLAEARLAYAHELRSSLADGGTATALPGVMRLLGALERVEGLTLGLLTGNFEETGRMKLAAAGIDADRFPVRVWGDDSPHSPPARAHLPPVAFERYASAGRGPITGERVTIVGDTEHDVGAALANGCRALAVATGRLSIEELTRAGAHRVVPDLTRTEEVVAWLTSP